MRLIKLIAPTALIATLALFAPHANAQTMGEYATTTAGVGTGAGSMGTSIGSAVNSVTTSGELVRGRGARAHWAPASTKEPGPHRGLARVLISSLGLDRREGSDRIRAGRLRSSERRLGGQIRRFIRQVPGSGSIPGTQRAVGSEGSLSGRRVGSESPGAGYALQLVLGIGQQLQFELTLPRLD